MTRRYFGTDGVRGVVGETLTPDLVERLGRAATLWSGRGRALVGRDTRASGPSSSRRSHAGSSLRGAWRCSAACCRPRLWRCSRRTSVSSCRRPTTPRVQRRQDLRPRRAQAERRGRARDRGTARCARASVAARSSTPTTQSTGYVEHVVEHFGTDLTGPADRRRLCQRRLLAHRAGGVRAARCGRDTARDRP